MRKVQMNEGGKMQWRRVQEKHGRREYREDGWKCLREGEEQKRES